MNLNTSRDGASTTSLGNLCCCLASPTIKNYFLNLYLPSFSLKSISPCPITPCLCNMSFPRTPVVPFR